MDKKLALQSFLSLLLIFFCSVVSGFLIIMLFGMAFTESAKELKASNGEEFVQNLMMGLSFCLFVVITVTAAYKRGRRRTKKEKVPSDIFFKFSSAAMVVFIIPALILAKPFDPTFSKELMAVYFPFMFLTNAFKVTQLSLLFSAFLATAAQYGAYRLGFYRWEKREKSGY